ncbi:hypothetical protein DFJ77DRAFT_473676 [Powellomyces hirtus]|nr:hypothetical protein DFJ77DRAFT_473676 [Powellomyces hirtus]
MTSSDMWIHEQKVDEALARIKLILDSTRSPTYATNVTHTYSDKYLLAEFLTTASFNAQWTCLELLGLNQHVLDKVREWRALEPEQRAGVTLRFEAEERCDFLREEERREEAPVSVETSVESSRLNNHSAIKSKFVTTVKEYVYQFIVHYKLSIFFGTDVASSTVLTNAERACELMTAVKQVSPAYPSAVKAPLDVNITCLLSNMYNDPQEPFTFHIDRTDEKCHTPRRNPAVTAVMEYYTKFYQWSQSVLDYFVDLAERPIHGGSAIDLEALSGRGTFVPVVPLFEKRSDGASVMLSPADLGLFLQEQRRSLEEKFQMVDKAVSSGKLITTVEGKLMVTLQHAMSLSATYASSVDTVESMLRNQLIAAIGHSLQPEDFTQLVRFNNQKLFKPQYVPAAFCFAVQRPNHSPEGIISIELDNNDASGGVAPMVDSHSYTFEQNETPVMYISINAATRVPFSGKRILHGCLLHQFSESGPLSLSLKARARQFSSFILMAGRIVSVTDFQPQAAIIVQNKDDLNIPLLLELIPTPKEFQDAIDSLSPEQQKFAKAMRALQLESTLFGICVVEIKPQLELLLNLPADSLTKEIRLTQDLMQLFTKYQIPSDLLRFDGDVESSTAAKLEAVREYVVKIKDAIKGTGAQDIENELDRARFNQLHNLANAPQAAQSFGAAASSTGLFGSPILPQAPGISAFGATGGSAPLPEFHVSRKMAAVRAPAAPMARSSTGSTQFRMQAEGSIPVPSCVPMPEQAQLDALSSQGRDPIELKQPESNFGLHDQSAESGSGDSGVDFTKFPIKLDENLRKLDTANALRPTVIKLGETWTRTRSQSILAAPTTNSLSAADKTIERNQAFDLLDALSRSGSMAIEHAVLHVVLAVTHCFDETLVDTVVRQNIDPLEKVEESSLILAAVVAGEVTAERLLKVSQTQRIRERAARLSTE